MDDELFATLLSDIRHQGATASGGEGASSLSRRQQIAKLDQLRHLIEKQFRTPEARARWMHAPSSGLGDRTPVSVLSEGDIDAVLKVMQSRSNSAPR